MAYPTSTKNTNLAAQDRLGELLGAGKIDQIDEVLAVDLVDHDPMPGQKPGAEGIKQFWTVFTTGFPDIALNPLVVSADDEYVTAVFAITGTHDGEFQGHAATGKSISVRGIQVGRFQDGKLVERWGATDEAGILQQIGAV